MEVQGLCLVAQAFHILLGAAGMAGDEVWDKLVAQPLFGADAAEVGVELAEERKRRLAHQLQDVVLRVLGSHFQAARSMVHYDIPQVAVIPLLEKVVPDAAADEGLLDPAYLGYRRIEGQQALVAIVEILAGMRMEARGAHALRTERQVAPVHPVHIGRRASDIGDIPAEIGHLRNLFHLGED